MKDDTHTLGLKLLAFLLRLQLRVNELRGARARWNAPDAQGNGVDASHL